MDGRVKKLMILGGSANQVPIIKASKEMGYYTFVCDMRDSVEGALLADEHIAVNYMDKERVLKIAREKEIDGITSNSEPAMLNVAYISQQLGLPGNTVDSIQTLLSKDKFRRLQSSLDGIFSPLHFVVGSLEELIEKTHRMKYSLIIKPTECSGTRGTSKINFYNYEEIRDVYNRCKEFSRNGLVTVEEYVDMKSLRVNEADVFVVGDKILWDGFFWAERSPEMPMLPRTNIFPIIWKKREFEKIKEAVNRVLKEANIKLGEYNVETYFTTENQVFVIEINPRQGGNYIPLLIKEHTGIDMSKLLVSTAVGDMNYFEKLKTYKREHNYITNHMVFAKKDGIYDGLFIDPEVKEYVQWVEEKYIIGDAVSKAVNAASVVAYIDLKFDSYNTQHKYTDRIEDYIYAKIK